MATANDAPDLLADLGPKARNTLVRETHRIDLPAGHTLFRVGDPGDAIYLVLSGSLGVYAPRGPDGLSLIALIGVGESVGEMSVISGRARSATVKAIRDSELLCLTKSRFDQLLKREPEIMAGLNRLLIHRLRQSTHGRASRIEPKTVAFLPASEDIDPIAIAGPLAEQIEAAGYRISLLDAPESRQGSRWFTELERRNDHIFLCGRLADEEWIRLCARQADRILLLADARGTGVGHLPEDLLLQRADHQLLDLVLLHDTSQLMRGEDAPWMARIPFNRRFHLRRKERRDWDRLARIIVGRALGLVLSGGGARAFSQIGVLKAMEDLKIAVDFVGGASMGAMLAAGTAMDWGADELSARVHEAFVRTNPLNDYTLPIVGLVKGRKVEQRLRENFGDTRIEDLWRSYFCVSANLTSGTLEVHRSGELVHALRASISLPGILPPVVDGDSLLADGAVMNNLPIDVMRGLHRGPIVAVDVTVDRSVTPDILETPTGWAWFSRFLNPPLITLLMRAGTVTSEARRMDLAGDADLLIEPPLGGIDIRDWKSFDRAVAIGYEHASEVLAGNLQRLTHRRMPQAA
jgi:NTE family protein